MKIPKLCKLLIPLSLLGGLGWWLGSGDTLPTSPADQTRPSSSPRKVPQVASTAPLTLSDAPPAADSTKAVPAPTDPLTAFADWTQRYLQADNETRLTLEAEGQRLAEGRRPAFKDLIQHDPRRALAEATPMVVRQKLPASIVTQLEERVAARGELRVYAASPDSADRGERPFVRYAETAKGETYEAFVYGRREQDLITKPNASLIGVAMDGQIAVSESPLRRLEIGEIPDASRNAIEVCPVSKRVTASEVPPGTPVAETVAVAEARDQLIYFCDGAHISVYEQTLIMGESSTGGALGFSGPMPAAAVPAVGVVRVLYVPAIFADQGETPTTEAVLHDVFKQVGDFYQAQSFGRLTLVGTVTPPVKLPRNQAWYKGKDTTDGFVKEVDGLSAEMAHAKEAARRLGYDWVDYDCFIVRSIGGARSPTSFGSIGSGQVWMRNDSASTVAHEVGHAFGLTHANFWLTNGASVAGPGGNEEYGDQYDNMGTGGPPASHYNAQAKNQVRWLPDEFAPPITASGTYRIYAFDTPRIEQGKRYGVRIIKDSERTYWGEYRTLFPANVWVTNGLLLGWKWPTNNGSNLQLLDTTPGSIGGKNDAPIALGSTFSDFESGIHVTTLAVNPNTTPPSLDVVVNLGQFAGNQLPVASLATSASVVPTNSPVTFTASATDADGDTLSYAWLWHDAVISPNAPVVSRSFSSAGIYTVSCVVSDMKGGTAVRNATITVGNGGSRFTIGGRITLSGQPMHGVNVTTSGTNGTLTDSDGYYTIANLAAGTYTVTPAGHGYSFNELFNNNITVGPSFSGADFTVDELPVVTLTAPVPVAAEGGATGTFRLTRTGSTAQSLAVNVLAAQGTAAKTLTPDYTFTPDYAAVSGTPYQAFTIPADSAFLDITVTALNDTPAEGDETVTLVMGLDATYVNASPVSASVTIQDADSVLPRVSLRLSSSQTDENGGQSLVCTLTRTGSTAAGLSVPITTSSASSATASTDYTALASSYTIPPGSVSTTFNLTPLDDSVAEPTEFILLSIATGAAFIADAGANAVNARIVDNDTQVVSLAVTDTTATEVDRAQVGAVPNPGVFLISRTGDTSAPLIVYYGVAGSALHGVDYETLVGSLTFPAGVTQLPLTIMPRMDAIGESPETVTVALAAGNGGYLLGSSSSGTVTIADSGAPPVLEVTASSTIATEPSTNGNFRITAKGTGTGVITVNYTVTGTATAGADYTTLSGSTTITLNNGTVVQNIPVSILNDSALEEMETIILTLTPHSAYTLWSETQSATLLLRDDDQPTVFVDPQVGTASPYSDFISETTVGTALKFWISRPVTTASALTVNYSLVGTATNGVDHTTLSGTAVIPANAPGIDVSFNTIADTTFEGTETVRLHLEPGGVGATYARGPDATIYITDDDAGAQSVAFASPGGSGGESETTVNIPVTLSTPATAPVSVEYTLDSGARTPTLMNGSWVRVVRTGTSFQTFTSADGTSWTAAGSARTLSMSAANYLAGIAVTSTASGTAAVIQVDNVSVTGLSGGGSTGAMLAANIGAVNPPGANVESGGLFEVYAGGPDISTNSTVDTFRYLYFPISSSANCTITARVLNCTSSNGNARAGVMIRETTNSNSMHHSMTVNGSGSVVQAFRLANTGSASSQTLTPVPQLTKPLWLRLTRTGDLFTASTSSDGNTFTTFGVAQTIRLSTQLLVGMAASSRLDGTLAQATFDNVSITPPPPAALEGRNIGFVNEPGSATDTGGAYTLTASGAGFMAMNTAVEDECYLVATALTGDFSITARLTGIPVGPGNAQAGLMIRENSNHRARCLAISTTPGSPATVDFRGRLSSTSTGEGFGVDYSLAPGILNFDIGEQTKNIVLNVTDDNRPEFVEFVTLGLRNANAALLGPQNTFTYSIVDNDAASSSILPVISFAAPTSQGAESASPVLIPVVLSEPSSSTITVDYTTTAGGTAANGSDFTAVSGTLTFLAGETYQAISLPILDNATLESNETVVLNIATPINAVLGAGASHTFTILDDDAPSVTITASDPTATEGGDSGAFTFTRTGPTTSSLTVNFVVAGSAASGTDFTAFSPLTSIVIPSGQPSVDLVVAPVQNTSPEIPETVIVTVNTGSGYIIANPSNATVTITDDEVNTVTIAATDAVASEVAGNGGEFTLTRTGPLGTSLSVSVSITGTATSNADYSTIATSRVFAANQSTTVIPVSILPDSLTEGNEELLISITPLSNYNVGSPSLASVTIVDDDLPPTVFISNPASKSTIIAPGNGLVLEATAADDNLPSPLTYTWSRLFGPGNVTFGTPSAASTTATFSATGVYGIRITVSDGQFTASDDIFVQSGGFSYANWISIDQGPPSLRGVSGESNGTFTLIGGGAGYTSIADSGHMMFRQLIGGSGDATIIARITGLSGASTRLAGITVRDTSWKGAKRVNLVLDSTGAVQFRARNTANNLDSATTTAGQTSPLWLRLVRSGGTITGAFAPDAAGAPGSWTTAGTSTFTMSSNLSVGMVVSAGTSTAVTATAVFDNVSVTPAFTGPALHSEDLGNYVTAGNSSEAGGIVTVNGTGSHDSSGGHFRYQQIWGDCLVTARLLTHAGVTRGAQSGIAVRDTTDNGPFGFYGNTTTDGFQAHWRSSPGGNTGALQTAGGVGFWLRLLRKGNTIVAFRAPNVGGVPGVWAQASGNLPAALAGPLLFGYLEDSNNTAQTATGTFSGLTIEPLNIAPVVDAGTMAATHSPFQLAATITDDGKPNPPAAITSLWTKLSGPGTASFSNPALEDPLVTLSMGGAYALRLTADDGDSRTFHDLAFSGSLGPYEDWQFQQFGSNSLPTAAIDADPDHDGQINLMEYATATAGLTANGSAVTIDTVTIGPDRFLRLTVPRNPNATDVSYQVQATGDIQTPLSWSASGLIIESNTSTQLRVRDHIPITPGQRRFMRAQVTR